MKDFTVILYSLPDGEVWVDWARAKDPQAALSKSIRDRSLRIEEVEVIGVFRGLLEHELLEA